MTIQFTKLQGNGNDFILIDEWDDLVVPDDKKAAFAKKCCHRRFGIGADGVLFVTKGVRAPLQMRVFNEDGSEAEMCGNGIRCFAKYALDKRYIVRARPKSRPWRASWTSTRRRRTAVFTLK